MREIKFRAWDKFHGKIVDGIAMGMDGQLIVHGYPEGNFVLQQYTGLKDKNGVEIYEGDIIASEDFVQEVVWSETQDNYNSRVGFVLPYELLYETDGVDNEDPLESDWEVIGNTYENPELLEQPA